MLDTLKRLFGGLQAKTAADYSGLRASVKSLLGRVHLHTKLSGDQVIRSFDEELTSALSDLSVDLESMTSDRGRSPKPSRLMLVTEPVMGQIDRILSTDVRFRDLGTFEHDLQQLMRFLQDLDTTVKRRKRWLARLVLLASVGPVLGYSIHWAIGTYYSAALLEHVDIIHPDTPFVLSEEDYYRVRYDDIKPYLERFEDHYFAETRGLSSDTDVMKKWPSITIYWDKYSKRYFIYVEEDRPDKAIFITPEKLVRSLELHPNRSVKVVPIFDEPKEGDEKSFLSLGLVTKQQLELYHEEKSRRSLPSVYDDAVATRWGAPRPKEEKNLFVQRVFIRNIKDTNVVNKLGVTVRRVADSEFFWDRFDVSTDLKITSRRHAVDIATTRTPIKDVSVSFEPISILDERVKPHAEGEDHIVTEQTYQPKFGEHKIFNGSFPVYFRFPTKDIPAGLLDSARELQIPIPKNERELDDRMKQVDDFVRKEQLISVPCVDDSVLIAAMDMDALKKTTTVSELDKLTIHVEYSLLDNTAKSRTEPLRFSEPFVFIDEAHRTDSLALADCVARGLEAKRMQLVSEGAIRKEMGASRFIQALDAAARLLADDLRVKGGEIVIEESFYFDLGKDPAPTSAFRRNVKILKDGDFVVINVALMSFPSGIYELDFLFNDDTVARVRVDPLWPQSLRYKPEDDPLFAAGSSN